MRIYIVTLGSTVDRRQRNQADVFIDLNKPAGEQLQKVRGAGDVLVALNGDGVVSEYRNATH
jgi:hypothetical protein